MNQRETSRHTPAEAFPLYWPVSWPRAKSRRDGPYQVTFGKALDDLAGELRRFGARGLVISSNVPIRQDGLPYASADNRLYDDPGVAVYFELRGKPYVFACDRWRAVRDNLRAIGLTVSALRAIDRAGASELLERAFTGFAQLPPAREAPPSWFDVLGVSPDAGKEEIEEAFKAKAKKAHPDVGGSHEAMTRLNQARESGLAGKA